MRNLCDLLKKKKRKNKEDSVFSMEGTKRREVEDEVEN